MHLCSFSCIVKDGNQGASTGTVLLWTYDFGKYT